MKRFLVLYHSSASAADQMSGADPRAAKTAMAAWMSWTAQNAGAFVDVGSPVGTATMLAGQASRPGHITGYGVIQAESLEAAKAIFERHPHFKAPNGDVELLELTSMVRRKDVPMDSDRPGMSTTIQLD